MDRNHPYCLEIVAVNKVFSSTYSLTSATILADSLAFCWEVCWIAVRWTHSQCKKKLTIDQKLTVINPLLSYIRKQNVDWFLIALADEIPYPLLQLWHNIVHKTEADQGNSADYLDLLNSWIPNKWFQISRETRFQIQETPRCEASSVVSKSNW